jgi:CRP/FNR family transcriptional regulator, cyclic AMP receptor protein
MSVPQRARKRVPNSIRASSSPLLGKAEEISPSPRSLGIFAQGDAADAVFYIQGGKVKLTVVSKTGREATLGVLGVGNFFGEGALAGQAFRMGDD